MSNRVRKYRFDNFEKFKKFLEKRGLRSELERLPHLNKYKDLKSSEKMIIEIRNNKIIRVATEICVDLKSKNESVAIDWLPRVL